VPHTLETLHLPPYCWNRSHRAHGCTRALRKVLLGASLAVSAVLGGATAGQAQQLYLGLGQGLYDSDPFCIDPDEFFSTFRFQYSRLRFGFSLSYENEDWPWPPPPEHLRGIDHRHGAAFQAVAEIYPLGFLGLDQNRVAQLLRPFVGAGLHVSRDGRTSTNLGRGGAMEFGIQGRTDPLITAGASLTARPDFLPFGLQLQYRHNVLFGRNYEFAGPEGDVHRVEGSQTLSWGELTAGVSIAWGG
jgi:hypothetical protein